MAADEERRVVVGVVSKPFGVRGEAYVHPDPDVAEDFAPGRVLHVSAPDRREAPATLTVASSRSHSGRTVVRFEGVDDREAVVALRGLVLSVPASEVTLDEDAFWADDLIGRDVVDDSGAPLGVVEGVTDGPAHDYLVVARPDGGEVMIPVVDALVEITGDAIVLHPIPGLLDDPDATQR